MDRPLGLQPTASSQLHNCQRLMAKLVFSNSRLRGRLHMASLPPSQSPDGCIEWTF